MSDINNICEHGHLERKCEVCELKAEIARLRSVCREQAEKLSAATVHMMPGGRARSHALGVICELENAGKEPSDGEH